MIVDGKAIAEAVKAEVKDTVSVMGKRPSLFVLVQNKSLAIEKFVGIKKKIGEEIGVDVIVHEARDEDTTDELISCVSKAATIHQGIIVQLPLSTREGFQPVDTQRVLDAVPVTHDVDVLSKEAVIQFQNGVLPILPPVVGAIKEILDRNNIIIKDKKIVVLGRGKLVGEPAALWLARQGGEVDVFTGKTLHIEEHTKTADILVLGTGTPGLIKPHMIKNGVVLFDAGTSEAKGKLTGDADPACADKCTLFTPTPGGIGPITAVLIFRNLLTLMENTQ